MEHPKFRIVIAGAGICGLATAVALRRSGREIIVLEQSRMNKEIGALISLQPNAFKIAAKLGIDQHLPRDQITTDKGFCIYDKDGNRLRTIDFDLSQPTSIRAVFHRVDLHDALKRAAIAEDGLTPPAKIQVASRVVGCDPVLGTVSLEDGTDLTADVIIGADGIHSVLRRSVFKKGEDVSKGEPKPSGVSAYRLLLSTGSIKSRMPNVDEHFDPTAAFTHMILGPDQRVVMGPARNGNIFGITALVPDEKLHEDSNSGGSWTTKGSVSDLVHSFDSFSPWIKELFTTGDNNETGDLALWQLRDIDPLPRWSTGRLILAGDSAHAMLPTQGQGASQSFEDAEALGAFLDDLTPDTTSITPEQVQAVGERYFKCRYERASLIQAYSRQQGIRPGAVENRVTLDPGEFLAYNTDYDGAKDWEQRQQKKAAVLSSSLADKVLEQIPIAASSIKVYIE